MAFNPTRPHSGGVGSKHYYGYDGGAGSSMEAIVSNAVAAVRGTLRPCPRHTTLHRRAASALRGTRNEISSGEDRRNTADGDQHAGSDEFVDAMHGGDARSGQQRRVDRGLLTNVSVMRGSEPKTRCPRSIWRSRGPVKLIREPLYTGDAAAKSRKKISKRNNHEIMRARQQAERSQRTLAELIGGDMDTGPPPEALAFVREQKELEQREAAERKAKAKAEKQARKEDGSPSGVISNASILSSDSPRADSRNKRRGSLTIVGDDIVSRSKVRHIREATTLHTGPVVHARGLTSDERSAIEADYHHRGGILSSDLGTIRELLHQHTGVYASVPDDHFVRLILSCMRADREGRQLNPSDSHLLSRARRQSSFMHASEIENLLVDEGTMPCGALLLLAAAIKRECSPGQKDEMMQAFLAAAGVHGPGGSSYGGVSDARIALRSSVTPASFAATLRNNGLSGALHVSTLFPSTDSGTFDTTARDVLAQSFNDMTASIRSTSPGRPAASPQKKKQPSKPWQDAMKRIRAQKRRSGPRPDKPASPHPLDMQIPTLGVAAANASFGGRSDQPVGSGLQHSTNMTFTSFLTDDNDDDDEPQEQGFFDPGEATVTELFGGGVQPNFGEEEHYDLSEFAKVFRTTDDAELAAGRLFEKLGGSVDDPLSLISYARVRQYLNSQCEDLGKDVEELILAGASGCHGGLAFHEFVGLVLKPLHYYSAQYGNNKRAKRFRLTQVNTLFTKLLKMNELGSGGAGLVSAFMTPTASPKQRLKEKETGVSSKVRQEASGGGDSVSVRRNTETDSNHRRGQYEPSSPLGARNSICASSFNFDSLTELGEERQDHDDDATHVQDDGNHVGLVIDTPGMLSPIPLASPERARDHDAAGEGLQNYTPSKPGQAPPQYTNHRPSNVSVSFDATLTVTLEAEQEEVPGPERRAASSFVHNEPDDGAVSVDSDVSHLGGNGSKHHPFVDAVDSAKPIASALNSRLRSINQTHADNTASVNGYRCTLRNNPVAYIKHLNPERIRNFVRLIVDHREFFKLPTSHGSVRAVLGTLMTAANVIETHDAECPVCAKTTNKARFKLQRNRRKRDNTEVVDLLKRERAKKEHESSDTPYGMLGGLSEEETSEQVRRAIKMLQRVAHFDVRRQKLRKAEIRTHGVLHSYSALDKAYAYDSDLRGAGKKVDAKKVAQVFDPKPPSCARKLRQSRDAEQYLKEREQLAENEGNPAISAHHYEASTANSQTKLISDMFAKDPHAKFYTMRALKGTRRGLLRGSTAGRGVRTPDQQATGMVSDEMFVRNLYRRHYAPPSSLKRNELSFR